MVFYLVVWYKSGLGLRLERFQHRGEAAHTNIEASEAVNQRTRRNILQ